jgi:GNAT superfamily N-acetyltransferase
MAEIKNFDTDGLFFKENMPFIERFYYEHFYLIKAYEALLRREYKVIDAFNVFHEDYTILFLATEAGIYIYGNGFNDNMMDLLYQRSTFKRYTNFHFAGNRAILIKLFERFDLPYTVDKERIIYYTKAVLPLKPKHAGNAVNSTLADFDALVQMSYDYSLEEWGERPGRGIDYVQSMVGQAIAEKILIQYTTNNGIVSLLQVLNMENEMPVIGSLYTLPDKRGKGYARMLVHAVTKKILGAGYDKVGIISDESNPVTNKMFKEIGFKPVYEHLSLICTDFGK